MPSKETLTAVDLFAGAGGMSLGLGWAGFQVVLAADYWIPAIASYRRNFPAHRFVQADLRGLDPSSLAEYGLIPGSVDLVAGGPPCQGFSIQRIGPEPLCHPAR
jgi:DNA (cytosine-5)-methyltransferase 1